MKAKLIFLLTFSLVNIFLILSFGTDQASAASCPSGFSPIYNNSIGCSFTGTCNSSIYIQCDTSTWTCYHCVQDYQGGAQPSCPGGTVIWESRTCATDADCSYACGKGGLYTKTCYHCSSSPSCSGTCQDTSLYCSVAYVSGLCPGGSNIQCCNGSTTPPTPTQPPTSCGRCSNINACQWASWQESSLPCDRADIIGGTSYSLDCPDCSTEPLCASSGICTPATITPTNTPTPTPSPGVIPPGVTTSPGCPPGQTNPHSVCWYPGGTCGSLNTCGTNECSINSNCVATSPPPPTNTPPPPPPAPMPTFTVRVFIDTDQDAVKDAGEAYFPGYDVPGLYSNCSNTSCTTDADCGSNYKCATGTYCCRETISRGRVLVCNGVDNAQGDIDLNNTTCQNNCNYNCQTASKCCTVKNQGGLIAIQSASDTQSGRTNSAGQISFTVDRRTNYQITLSDLPVEYRITSINPQTILSTYSSNTIVYFGITTAPPPTPTPAPYTVSGYIFIDTNKNSVKDGSETCYNGAIRINFCNTQYSFNSTPACNTYGPYTCSDSCSTVSIVPPGGYSSTGWAGTGITGSNISGTGASAYVCK